MTSNWKLGLVPPMKPLAFAVKFREMFARMFPSFSIVRLSVFTVALKPLHPSGSLVGAELPFVPIWQPLELFTYPVPNGIALLMNRIENWFWIVKFTWPVVLSANLPVMPNWPSLEMLMSVPPIDTAIATRSNTASALFERSTVHHPFCTRARPREHR